MSGSSSAPSRLYWRGHARGDPVERSRPSRSPRTGSPRARRRRRRWTARRPGTRGSARGARSRSRSGSSTGCSGAPATGSRRRRPGAVEPEQAARGDGRHGDLPGSSGKRLATARATASRGALERQRCAAPAAAHLDLDLAGSSVRLPDRHPQRAAEQLGVGELLARAGVAVVVEHVEARAAQLVVEPLGERALLAARLAERRPARRRTARARAARRSRARRRTARPRRRRCAPGPIP